MTNDRAQQRTIAAFFGVLLFFTLHTSVEAQLPPGPPTDRTNPDRERQQDMNRREMLLRGYGLTVGRPSNSNKQLRALAEQVEQDFTRILILHNEIARAISGTNKLDYGFISEATTEIKKRAGRLQSTLLLKPEVEQTQDKAIGSNDAQVKDALITLCHQIKSFVTNPVIENPGTVNVEQLNKARQDLESVVGLSFSIRKTADKLIKSHK
jgi:hypothetical protein